MLPSPDPILSKAARALVAAQQRAQKAGVPIAPEDLDAFVREETKGRYGLPDAQKLISSIDTGINPRNLLRSAVQGATMNWGDEILGKIPSVLGGGPGAEEDMRLRGEMFKNANPKTDFTAGLLGSIAPTLLAPEAEAMSLGAAAGRGAATGAVVGGLSGAGAGEDAHSREVGGAVGGIGGAALGAIVPSLVGGMKYAFSPAARASARMGHAIEQSGGADAVRATVAGMDAAGRGGDVMLGDASAHLRQLTDFAANNSDDVLVPLAKQTAARQRNSAGRLLDDVRQNLAGGDADATLRGEQLKSAKDIWAAGPDGYGGVREANPPVNTAAVQPFLKVPAVMDAWKSARLAGDIKASDPLDNMFNTLVDGKRPVTFADMQSFRKILSDKVSAAFSNGQGELANSYKTVREAVNKAMNEAVPATRGLDAQYHSMSNLERALQAGSEDFHIEDTRGLARKVNTMQPAELDQYRHGMASELISQLRAAKTNRGLAAQLMAHSQAMEDKLKLIFGDNATFEKFMQNVSAESELGKMSQTFGNSATARRLQAAGFDPAEVGVDAGIMGAVHGPAGIAHAVSSAITKATKKAVTRNTARELGPQLMLKGAPNIEAFLAKFAQRDPLVGKFGSTVAPAAGAHTIGSLFQP